MTRTAVVFLRSGPAWEARDYTWALIDGRPRHVTTLTIDRPETEPFDYRRPPMPSKLAVTVTTVDGAQHEIPDAIGTMTERMIGDTHARRHSYVVREAHSTGV